MAQKIQFRRGLNASRTSVVFDQGEPVWTTDLNKLFIGNGTTAGGVSISDTIFTNNESFTAIIPTSGTTAAQNASGLYLALEEAARKRPYGSGLSDQNRYTILLFPGLYDFSSYDFIISVGLNKARYVDLVGVGNKNDIILRNLQNFGFTFVSGYANYENLTFHGGTSYMGTNGDVFKNMNFNNINFYNISPNYVALRNNSTSLTSNITFNEINTSGGFLGLDDNANGVSLQNPITNCLISNSTFFGRQSFAGHINAASKNNIIENCNIISTDSSNPTFYCDLSEYSFDSTNLFRNCYFSGENLAEDGGADQPFQARLDNCRINGYFTNFEGIMEDCTVNGKDHPTFAPLTISNNVTFPCFYNCTFLAGNNIPSVSGNPNINGTYSSGMFSHCTFNRPVATGVTGTMGNNFNIVNVRFK